MLKPIVSYVFVISLTVFSTYFDISYADDQAEQDNQAVHTKDYYNQHAIGWHWYNEPTEERIKKQQTSQNPVEQMNAVKAAITEALDKAILNPTPENIADYIKLQNTMSQKASNFSNIWQLVLLEHPELNYALKNPTNNLAKQIYLDAQDKKEVSAIKKLAEHNGLFFFYKSSCPYCQKFAPIVKNFEMQYGVAVIPVSLDGVALPEFPDSRIDNGQAAKFKVTVTPSLFAVNPYNHKAFPIAYGFISEEDLKQRFLDLATNFREED